MKTALVTFDFTTKKYIYSNDGITLSWSPSGDLGGIVVSDISLDAVDKKFDTAAMLFTLVANLQRQQSQLTAG